MPARPTLLQVGVRFGLGVLAFILLWRFPEPSFFAIPSSNPDLGQLAGPSLASLFIEVLVGVVAGAVFALAARPVLGDWMYRWELPAALGVIPGVVIAVQLLVYSGAVTVGGEGALSATADFLVSNFSLRVTAILLGVALAQGVVAADGEEGAHAPSENASGSTGLS